MSVKDISFYDFLGKLVPGVLLLGLFVPASFFDESNVINYVAFFSVAYIIGIIYEILLRYLFFKLRRNPCMLARAYKSQLNVSNIKSSQDINSYKDSPKSILDKYDEAYSLLMINNMLGSIPIQEAHENFLKGIWPITIFYFFKVLFFCPCGFFCSNCIDCRWLASCIFILVLLIPLAWYKVQMKIYFTVWDNAMWTQVVLKKQNVINSSEKNTI